MVIGLSRVPRTWRLRPDNGVKKNGSSPRMTSLRHRDISENLQLGKRGVHQRTRPPVSLRRESGVSAGKDTART